jgi:hypothetical protein
MNSEASIRENLKICPVKAWGVLRIILAAVLLLTATLKLRGFQGNAINSVISDDILLTGAILEFGLGVWLLTGLRPSLLWCCTLLLFASLTVISGYLVLIGQSSCNCLGRIQSNPIYLFVFDCAALVLLLFARPFTSSPIPTSQPHESVEGRTTLFASFLKSAGILLAGVIFAYLFITLANPYLNFLSGRRIAIEPAISSAGKGQPGDDGSFSIRVHNQDDHPITLVGGTTSCSCAVIEDLPITIPAHGHCIIKVKMRFSGSPGLFQHRFIVYTDDQKQPSLVAKFTGEVIQRHSK